MYISKSKKSRIAGVLLVLFVAVAFILVSNMEYEDEKRQKAYQCDMIESGYWPAEVNRNC